MSYMTIQHIILTDSKSGIFIIQNDRDTNRTRHIQRSWLYVTPGVIGIVVMLSEIDEFLVNLSVGNSLANRKPTRLRRLYVLVQIMNCELIC